MQEEDNVPEDRGPVQDLWEVGWLDQVHDARDHTQRDCHVGTHTEADADRDTVYTDIDMVIWCVVFVGPWWWLLVTCLPSPNHGRFRARYSVISARELVMQRRHTHRQKHSGEWAPGKAQREENRWWSRRRMTFCQHSNFSQQHSAQTLDGVMHQKQLCVSVSLVSLITAWPTWHFISVNHVIYASASVLHTGISIWTATISGCSTAAASGWFVINTCSFSVMCTLHSCTHAVRWRLRVRTWTEKL